MPKAETPVIEYVEADFHERAGLAFMHGAEFNDGVSARNALAAHFAEVANQAVARVNRETVWSKDLIDVATADSVELVTGPNGKVWVNINGKCVFRAAHADVIRAEITKG